MKKNSEDNILPNCRLPYSMNDSGAQMVESDDSLS